MRGLEARRILDRRLDRASRAPVAVAFSGGGDSLALLLVAKAWADRAGRRLVALTVDHAVQNASAEWGRWCAERSHRLGVRHETLVWRAGKPATGLPAAARAARHKLLADAAREAGAAVILLGHTADDVAEAAAMRAAGSTTPSPRDWSPSPAWPEGRGLFLLRPLIHERRDGLRAWLRAHGEVWIDDPANDDLRYARARARHGAPASLECRPVSFSAPPLAQSARGGGDGALDLSADAGPAALAAAMLCAAGTTRTPAREALARATAALDAGRTVTLAGARAVRRDERVLVCREPGELRRRGVGETFLKAGETAVWDGRFEVNAQASGLALRPLQGLAARLPKAQREALRALPVAVRPGLPAIVTTAGEVSCPILAGPCLATVRSLALERYSAAVGMIGNEAAIWRVAKAHQAS